MWIQISNEDDIKTLMQTVCYFHDSCLKEMKYTSGAYVNENLSMKPINDSRILSMVFQRQSHENSVIVLEFRRLKYVKLFPIDEKYTCEIHDATLCLRNKTFFWCDCGGLSVSDIETYDGVIVCAEELYWKSVDGHLGSCDYFQEIGG